TPAPPTPARPAAPSRRRETIAAVLVGIVILVATVTLDANWARLLDLPRASWDYAVLMFQSPDWERLPRALFEMWRSISMAWLGALLCVALSVPLGMFAARGVG